MPAASVNAPSASRCVDESVTIVLFSTGPRQGLRHPGWSITVREAASARPEASPAKAAGKPSRTRFTGDAQRKELIDGGAARAVFAGGCFWGVEHYFEKVDGVQLVTSGYAGASKEAPTYKQVSTGTTGHAEAVEVLYDAARVDFETLARLFFEIHDPTQKDRQGPDVGRQYRSVIYFSGEEERAVADRLIAILKGKGLEVVTEVAALERFWPAEDYHQDYYERTGGEPYCHVRVKRF